MTKIINIQELYNLIPETKKLEGVNFTNLRHLLTSVIENVEQSGVYEFVQYIQGNPSLFIIREKPLRSDDRLTNERFGSVSDVQFETSKRGKVKVKTSNSSEDLQKTEEKRETLISSDTDLFPTIKLPW
jgi:hypothetical protein